MRLTLAGRSITRLLTASAFFGAGSANEVSGSWTAMTSYPRASSMGMTLPHEDPSANAPWTRTIHKSRIGLAWLAAHGAKIRLHFLPPYCPEENRIERPWLDLHANVTRNHR